MSELFVLWIVETTNTLQILEGMKFRTKATVDAEELLIHDRGQG